MKGLASDNSFTLQFRNYTYRTGKVRTLDVSSPLTRTATRFEYKGTSAVFANRFLNEDKSNWVNDGKTIPVAFGDTFNCQIAFFCGGIPYAYNFTIAFGTTFLQLSEQISDGIFALTGGCSTDDWGMDVFYHGGNLFVNFNVYNDNGENWGNFINVTSGTGYGTPNPHTEEVLDSGVVGTQDNTVVEVIDVSGGDYTQTVVAHGTVPVVVSDMTVSASNNLQALAPIEIKHRDVNGNEEIYYEIPTIDPYQFQLKTSVATDFVMDATTFVEVVVEGDSRTRITMDYGENEYDQLAEVNFEEMATSESDSLELAYSNFNGIEVEENKQNNIAWWIVGILALLYITK